jgi:PEGA domain
MRPFWRAAAIAALGCVLLGASPGSVPSGALFLTTLPVGADAWVDGTYVGRTPVLVDALTVGHHAVSLTRTGWTARDVDVDVASGATTMSSIRLVQGARNGRPAAGTATFHELPPEARLVVDGVAVANPGRGAVPLAAGTHVAVVVTQKGKTAHTFTVYPETTTQVVLSMPAVEAVKSAVVAPAEEYLPTDAYHVDGKKVTVRYESHEIVGRIGELPMRYDGVTVSYDAAPALIGGRLYLPLALLARLTAEK